MATIELATQYINYVDEIFSAESKKAFLTNDAFSFAGAHSVKVYKVSTAAMQEYGRGGADSGNWSRYGSVASLDSTTQTMLLSKDRSFTFAVDRMDEDETQRALTAAAALARQVREVVIPEVDSWTYSKMCAGAGFKPTALALTTANIYTQIITGSKALDNAEVPDTGRFLLVTPDTYFLMKQNSDIIMQTDIGQDMRALGVVASLDGMTVIRVPAARLPAKFGFMLVHPSSTVAPVKLESYKTHIDPPGISGDLVEGRVAYDAFVLDNKAKGLYYQAIV